MTLNEFLTISRASGVKDECTKERIHDKRINVYHLYCNGKHGQKFIPITDPDAQMSKELENDLFIFLIKLQEQDKI
ncbi:MAG: hypothetical protein FWD44_08255 [Oscillospiraceae bacterium]|nr:hypothetical protein [Oscillospiraceae bacterium]